MSRIVALLLGVVLIYVLFIYNHGAVFQHLYYQYSPVVGHWFHNLTQQ